jgi:hypothetical protein
MQHAVAFFFSMNKKNLYNSAKVQTKPSRLQNTRNSKQKKSPKNKKTKPATGTQNKIETSIFHL